MIHGQSENANYYIRKQGPEERIYQAGVGRARVQLHVLPLTVPGTEISDQGGRNPCSGLH